MLRGDKKVSHDAFISVRHGFSDIFALGLAERARTVRRLRCAARAVRHGGCAARAPTTERGPRSAGYGERPERRRLR
jgi:hypothetical protein